MPFGKRQAFTLIEILVVITILIVLTVLVVSVYNINAGADKVRSAARTAQSAFLGARDRALHAKALRGIRLIRDSSDQSIVTGFAYIQPIDRLEYPPQSIRLERPDDDGDGSPDPPGNVVIVHGFGPPDPTPHVDWYALTDFFSNPPRIRIPATTGQWYTFSWTTTGTYALTSTNANLRLTSPFIDPGAPGFIAHPRNLGNSSCEIELAPELLPNHAPISLPSGVVVDLFYSAIPGQWFQQQSIASSAAVPVGWVEEGPDLLVPGNRIIRQYSRQIDTMFSPRGMVSGPISALGPIHLLLNDIQDATQGLNPISPTNKGEKLVLTIFPQTGNVATFPIDPTDSDGNGIADDLFRFAKLGSVAGN